MKKLQFIILLAFIQIFVTIIGAQNKVEAPTSGISFGLVTALNSSTLLGDFPERNNYNLTEKIDVQNKFGFDLGMNIDYQFNRFMSLQMDACYSRSGGKVLRYKQVNNELDRYDIDSHKYWTMNYLKFPVSLSIYPVNGLYINAGAYASFLVSSKKYDEWRIFNVEEEEVIGGIDEMDYGVIAGFGFNTKVAKIGFQYTYGVTDILPIDDAIDLRNGAFQFIVRWKFYSETRK